MAIALSSKDDLRFQLRRDLEFSEYPIGIVKQTVVKDPVKLEYYLFEPFERLLLSQLDEPKSAEEIKESITSEPAGKGVMLADIRQFLQRLLNDNLVVLASHTNGNALWNMRKKRERQAKWRIMAGILAIRFKGVDPQRFLDWLNPYTKVLFQPFFFLLAAVAFGFSILTLLLNLNRVFDSAFWLNQLYRPETLIWIALALMIVKVLHELGHALACRSIDRNCHEIGVLLLAFVPCLYCNVSDVWMEPKKWKRMVVSAAGIYMEMLIAVVCVPLWMFSGGGSLQVFWLAMISICTFNTLLVNGNPLLRYDGYYFLSDWLDVPNLYSKSQKRVSQRLRSFFFAGDFNSWSLLELYGLLAIIYRYFVLAVIFIAVYSFFVRMELGNVGWFVSIVLAICTFGGALAMAFQRAWNSDWRSLEKGKVAIVCLIFLIVLFASMFVQTTPEIFAQGKVGVTGNAIVFAPDSGKVAWEVMPGDKFAKGDLIGRIENSNLQIKIMEQNLRVEQLELELKNLEVIQSKSGDYKAADIELTKDAVNSAKMILKSLRRQLMGLNISASDNGTLLMLPQQKNATADKLNLTRKHSTLLSNSRGAFVSTGEPIAIIVNRDNKVVNLEVAESDVQYVEVGQKVKLLILQASSEYQFGTVCAILDRETLASTKADIDVQDPQDGYVLVQVRCESLSDAFFQSSASAVIFTAPVSWLEWIARKTLENLDIK